MSYAMMGKVLKISFKSLKCHVPCVLCTLCFSLKLKATILAVYFGLGTIPKKGLRYMNRSKAAYCERKMKRILYDQMQIQ